MGSLSQMQFFCHKCSLLLLKYSRLFHCLILRYQARTKFEGNLVDLKLAFKLKVKKVCSAGEIFNLKCFKTFFWYKNNHLNLCTLELYGYFEVKKHVDDDVSY